MTAADADGDRPTFSRRLREATSAAHAEAEGGDLMTRLVRGTLPVAGFTALTGQLYLVYEALEATAGALRRDPTASDVHPFLDPALERRDALAADLTALAGPEGLHRLRPLPATERYTDHLRALRGEWPGLFLAHHYTRYLGDLSGGLAIGAIAARTYGLTPDHGVAFSTFVGVPSPKRYKDAYRARLDDLPWDGAQRQLVIDETVRAYRFNTAVLAELSMIDW